MKDTAASKVATRYPASDKLPSKSIRWVSKVCDNNKSDGAECTCRV